MVYSILYLYFKKNNLDIEYNKIYTIGTIIYLAIGYFLYSSNKYEKYRKYIYYVFLFDIIFLLTLMNEHNSNNTDKKTDNMIYDKTNICNDDSENNNIQSKASEISDTDTSIMLPVME